MRVRISGRQITQLLLYTRHGAEVYEAYLRATARQLQRRRFDDAKTFCNAHMNAKQIKKHCQSKEDVKDLLRTAINQLNLSARAYDRILKLARTIADLYSTP